MVVVAEPFQHAEHEEIEQRATDKGGGGASVQAGRDLGDGVARHAEIVEGVVGDGVEVFTARVNGLGGSTHGERGEADDGEPFLFRVERDLDG